jgi:hypothetical protein
MTFQGNYGSWFLGRADSDVPALGDQKGMMGNKQHCPGSNANNA